MNWKRSLLTFAKTSKSDKPNNFTNGVVDLVETFKTQFMGPGFSVGADYFESTVDLT